MTYFAKALAFTLAETLVVMGIIGVVAALTIPNLNQSTGDREKVAKVKKIYSNLEDAYGRATAVYGPIDEWFEGIDDDKAITERLATRISEFMKVSKVCGFSEGCFSSQPIINSYGDELGENYLEDLIFAGDYMLMLADGTSLAFDLTSGYKFRVDIDGPNKGKNQVGNDIFDFTIPDEPYNGDQVYSLMPSLLQSQWTGYITDAYTTAWVIQNGNMDYLKCDDLNWETKTSCK